MKIMGNCCGQDIGGRKIPTDETAKKQAEFLKAISDPARVKIVYALGGGDLCVCEIMELLKMPQTMVSHHCKILKVAGIISDRKTGPWVYYSLTDRRVLGMLETLYTEG
jgi:DNA-binding transcriptional ArsR family regulator